MNKEKIKVFIFAGFLTMCISSYSQSKDESAISRVLAGQITDWNKGDIDHFMESYWQNDSLQFIGKTGITYGWKQTMENYKKRYPDPTAMGKLTFDLLEIKKLSALYFFVVGKWALTRSIGNLNGYFTLLFKKINNKWLIITDHST